MLIAALLASTIASALNGEDRWSSLTLEDGRELHYLAKRPVEPAGEDPETPPPRLLLALPPGRQDLAMAERSFELYFDEGARRNFVVVIPRKIGDRMFHDEDSSVLLQLLDHAMHRFHTDGLPALAGISNGGRSAFHLALDHPERFSSLTVLPGMPPTEQDFSRLDRLGSLPLAMFVGGEDEGWRERMRQVQQALPHATLTVIDGEGHTPPSLKGGMVFDAIPPLGSAASTPDSPDFPNSQTVKERAVTATLDDFHDAASKADGARYFRHFAPDAVFLGTDAKERWSVEEFRAYAEPYFSVGKGWTYVATERHVSFSPAGDTAWFDERLHNDKYGEVRGSGVLVLIDDRWRIAQYNLAFPVPNELSSAFLKLQQEAEH